MHIREQIRNAVFDLLNYSGKSTYQLVKDQRRQVSRNVGNILNFYIDSDTITPRTIHPIPLYERLIQVVVEARIRVQGSPSADHENQLDDICEEIETQLTQSSMTSAVDLIKSFLLDSTTTEIDDSDADRSYLQATLLYNVIVHNTDGNPSTLI